jgi:hypothetical protein
MFELLLDGLVWYVLVKIQMFFVVLLCLIARSLYVWLAILA